FWLARSWSRGFRADPPLPALPLSRCSGRSPSITTPPLAGWATTATCPVVLRSTPIQSSGSGVSAECGITLFMAPMYRKRLVTAAPYTHRGRCSGAVAPPCLLYVQRLHPKSPGREDVVFAGVPDE